MPLSLMLVLGSAILAIVGADKPEKVFLNDGRGQTKLLHIKEYAHNVSVDIKNLVIDKPTTKLQFIDMANELIYKMQTSIYEINQGLPTVQNAQFHDNMAQIIDKCIELAHDIQHVMHGSIEDLKDALAASVMGIASLAQSTSGAVTLSANLTEIFISNQIRKAANTITYGIQKLRFEITFFNSTNKELERVIDDALATLIRSLHNLTSEDSKAEEELVHLAQNLERVLGLSLIKLENFLHVNAIDDRNTGVIQDVLKGLSEASNKFHQLTTGFHKVPYIKARLEALYKDVVGTQKKLLGLELSENHTGEQFIRSSLFDAITLSHLYAKEIDGVAENES